MLYVCALIKFIKSIQSTPNDISNETKKKPSLIHYLTKIFETLNRKIKATRKKNQIYHDVIEKLHNNINMEKIASAN